MTAPYGFFPTPFSAQHAVAASVEQGQLQCSEQGVFWVEFRPQEGGRSVLCFLPHVTDDKPAAVQVLTPPGFSVRSKVHEYGGAAWCLFDDRMAFVNGEDQQIYLQKLTPHSLPCSQPHRLTHTADCRYADLLWDARFARLIAVQEQATADPTQPINRLVSIALDDGRVEVLVEGSDFYASPTLSDNGGMFAWISWNHPHMPWDSTQLQCATMNAQGRLEAIRLLAGAGGGESLQQPAFLPDNALLCVSDRSGWWNLYRYLPAVESVSDAVGGLGDAIDGTTGGTSCGTTGNATGCTPPVAEPLWSVAAELGIAQWQLGVRTWGILTTATDTWLVGAYLEQGQGYLAIQSLDGRCSYRVSTEFTLFRHLCCQGERFYCVAAADDRASALIEVRPDFNCTAEIRVLAGGEQVAALATIARPQAISYPVAQNEQAHGFLYLPQTLPGNSKPPLLVFTHGGPTGCTYPVFNPKIQFWTARGFAVVDLNYRGSAGYGRAYRDRLHLQWGVSDIEDCVAAVDYLAASGCIDGTRVFIRGGSAGGFTTLCALAFCDRFSGGASHYGVSDPLTLTRDTHKFESHYLDWLIGDPQRDIERYRARTPLLAAQQISCPVIFFQGAEDKVVLPDQTEKMVDALRQQGVRVEYHRFEGEQHGFRRSENQIAALEAELAFYQSLL